MLDRDWVHRAVLALSQKLDPAKAGKWETQSGKVFFKYLRARYHLEAIRSSYSAIIREQDRRLTNAPKTEIFYSGYTGPLAEPLFFHLDGYFEALKTCQDFNLPCLGSAGILVSPPNSLHKYCSKASDAAAPNIDQVLRESWATCGEKTKQYRDCFSHHVALLGHVWQTAINMKWDLEEWHVRLYVPDNPEALSYDAFKYDERIDALALCTTLFDATEQLLRAVIVACITRHGADPSSVTQQSYSIRNVVIGD